MKKFEFVEHTADLAIRVFGKSVRDLFENAAFGLFEILTDVKKVEEKVEERLEVDGEGLEELLVNWLGELLYLHDAKGFLFRRFRILDVDPWMVRGIASGERFDPGRHIIKTILKAVTYHQVYVRHEKGRWVAQVIFDA